MQALVSRGAAVLLCVVGVPLLVLGLVHAFYGASISAYRPIINDEVAYWHQALTFTRAGFHGGYYTSGEVTNASGFTPFGAHGPGYAVLYGLFGKVFGWHRHTAIILNLIAIGGAAWIWTSVIRASLLRLLLSGLLLLTFWHMAFWAPSGMQESLHHAGAIVVAACFASALGSSPQRWQTVLGWLVLGLLSFIRPSWIILLPLWAFVIARHARRPVIVAAVAASVAYGAVIVIAYSLTTAPYETSFFFLRAASLSLGIRELTGNVTSNLQRLASPDQFHPIELLERHQYLGLLIAAGVAAVIAKRLTRPAAHFAVAASVLTIAFVAMMLLYQFTNYAEHRVLSAFLLFAALLCLAAPGRIGPLLATGLIVSSVVSAHVSLASLEDAWRDRFVWDRRGISELERAMDGVVVYRPDASRWCNTLLTSQYPPHLIAVPAGIGLSVVRKPELMTLPPRSHYMLLDEPVRAAFVRPINLRPVATLPYGTLYVNLESECGAL